MAGNLRKAMGIGSKEPDLAKRIQPETEGSHMAPAAAAAALVPVGLTAFAVSAYIRGTYVLFSNMLQLFGSSLPLASKLLTTAIVFSQHGNNTFFSICTCMKWCCRVHGLPIGKRAESDSVCHHVVGCTAAPYFSVLDNVTEMQEILYNYCSMQADLRQLEGPGANYQQ